MTPRTLNPFRRRAITCQELVELVTAYLEGELSRADRRRFEAHIGACPHCSAYVEQMRATLAEVGRIPFGTLSPDAERELLAAFPGWHEGRA